MGYRQEIDGLRTIAVVAVILFHAKIAFISGGYVGVDIFFVISGYLITGTLLHEMGDGSFSLARFYERRARRIFPALFVVVLSCVPFAWHWMLPWQLRDFGQDIVATALFSSNILYMLESGYFEQSTELAPLLHTWSLAVEEQFYVIFPVLLLISRRLFKNGIFILISSALIGSLILSEISWRHWPDANFYLIPSRAWEILVGALCAFYHLHRRSQGSDTLSVAGLVLIGWAIFAFDHNTPAPSLYMLAPVGGAALIILYGLPGTILARLLSAPWMTGLGLISYSAYLWHQPLFAFARLQSMHNPSHALMACMLLLTFLLGYCSWRWVEQPFRRHKNPVTPTRRAVLMVSVVTGGMLVVAGLTLHFGKGFPSRARAYAGQALFEEGLPPTDGLSSKCQGFAAITECQTTPRPTIALWGDSFAKHLVPGLQASGGKLGLQQLTMSTCAPILGIARTNLRSNALSSGACMKFNAQVIQWLSQHAEIEVVIISSYFRYMLNNRLVTRQGTDLPSGDTALVASQIKATVRTLHAMGKRVVIISPTPISGWDNGQCVSKSMFFNKNPKICNFSIDPLDKANVLLNMVSQDAPIYWLAQDICPNATCQPRRGNVALYRDRGHLTREGSAYLGQRYQWLPRFVEMAR